MSWPTTRLLTVLGLVAGSLCLAAAPASAHTSLVASTPANGASLTQAPTQVQLRFSENVGVPSAIVVTGPGGRVSRGTVRVVDNTVSIDVRLEPLPAYVGRYDLAYRVVSADGHPVSDQLTFDYRPPGVRAAPPADSGAPDRRQAPSRSHSAGWVAGGVAAVVLVGAGLLGGLRRSRPGRQR